MTLWWKNQRKKVSIAKKCTFFTKRFSNFYDWNDWQLQLQPTKLFNFYLQYSHSQHIKPKLPKLVFSAIELNVEVICVQEHRLYHPDIKLIYHDVGKGWSFISASVWRNSINATIGGVGMLLSPTALRTLNSIEEIANFNC